MNLDFLKYVDDHPRPVLVVLLGLLSIGAIVGSMYVQTLRVSLEERDKIIEARLKLLEDQRQSDMRSLRASNAVLRQQTEAITQSVKAADSALDGLQQSLGSSAARQGSTVPGHRHVHALRKELDAIGGAVARSGETLRLIDSLKISSLPELPQRAAPLNPEVAVIRTTAGRGGFPIFGSSSPSASEPYKIPREGKPSRSIDDIKLVIERNTGSILALYNRALRDTPSLQGRVVVQLRINPNGSVVDSRIVSSELKNGDFEQKLVARMRSFDFGAKDVETMVVSWPLDFLSN